MRILLIHIFLALFISSISAQLPNGIYTSTKNSYRTNYFLKVEKDSVTFLGWEAMVNEDTIYFATKCKNDSNGLIFTDYRYTKSRLDRNSFDHFIADPNIITDSFVLHNHLFECKVIGSKIHLLATKNIYFSRADEFEFIKLD